MESGGGKGKKEKQKPRLWAGARVLSDLHTQLIVEQIVCDALLTPLKNLVLNPCTTPRLNVLDGAVTNGVVPENLVLFRPNFLDIFMSEKDLIDLLRGNARACAVAPEK
ncbi:unnamed protein product [Pleuronectes platessa]|uniref:Uncharacterized protein n=1 Tax=Pleuronectes platessa TaxID=8262 RepID=A0A9N7TKR6_PLEPL|nr:unnamed protein product [Pleuronectes platessa]